MPGESSPGAIFNDLEEACRYIETYTPVVAYKVHYLGNFNIIDSPEEQIYLDEWEKRGKKVIIYLKI